MRIAEDLVNTGMSAGQELNYYITNFISDNNITKIIETGTYHGNGTTMSVIAGLLTLNRDFEFYSVEVNPSHYKIACDNVPNLEGIHLVNGLSIPFDLIENEIDYDSFPEDIIVDHKENREELYRKEVSFKVVEDVIGSLIKTDFYPELFILDSAGHIGFTEYKYVRELMDGKEYYMILDDVNHIKHFHSAKDLEETAEIIWSTEDKFGALCAHIR